MTYKYNSAWEWLVKEGTRDMILQLAKEHVTNDDIQDMFQGAMDRDGFFLDLEPCALCEEIDFDNPERTKCHSCEEELCDDCLEMSDDDGEYYCELCYRAFDDFV